MGKYFPSFRTILLPPIYAFAALAVSPHGAKAQACEDFNCFMSAAAQALAASRGNLGWCHSGTFTRNLSYQGSSISRAPSGQCSGNAAATSCNGAVFETIMEALAAYSRTFKDVKISLPLETFNSTRLDELRSHLFLFEPRSMEPFDEVVYDVGGGVVKFNKDDTLHDFSDGLRKDIRAFESRSIAHALVRFGLADPVPMSDMRHGDVVTFNRDVMEVKDGVQTGKPTGTQHSVTFMGWVGKDQKEQKSAAGAVGFKYISSQSNPKGQSGFGIRWAYFSGFCPQDPENTLKKEHRTSCQDQRKPDDGSGGVSFPIQVSGQKSDCCVIRKDGGLTGEGIKAGRVRDPKVWSAAFAVARSAIRAELSILEKRAIKERAEWLEARRSQARIRRAVNTGVAIKSNEPAASHYPRSVRLKSGSPLQKYTPISEFDQNFDHN